jgi:hypothetical protein
MGKIVIWVVVVLVILVGLRLLNVAKAKERREGRAPRRQPPAVADTMVRCVACGTFIAKADAQAVPEGYRCGPPGCPAQR